MKKIVAISFLISIAFLFIQCNGSSEEAQNNIEEEREELVSELEDLRDGLDSKIEDLTD
jgi:hypothetical protein